MAEAADFGPKLALALKALNISRGRLAAEARIDKSLVSRWLRGLATPRGHNLEAVTALVRQSVPAFNQLSWELPLEAFARLLGAAEAEGPGPPVAPRAADWASVTDREAARLRGAAYEGFWRGTHASTVTPGQFRHEYARIRREADDLLHMCIVMGLTMWEGPLLVVHDQLFGLLREQADDTFAFFLFQGVVQPRAEVLDGLVLIPSKSSQRAPSALPYLIDRIEDLSGDRAADDARLEDFRLLPAEADDSAEDLLRHLTRGVDASHLFLRLPVEICRSYGVNPTR
jgi:hypothetical protein